MAQLDPAVFPFRARRFSLFIAVMKLHQAPPRSVRVLDMGGDLAYWQALRPLLPPSLAEIVIVNLDQAQGHEGIIRVEHGDATQLTAYQENAFDIVHSNSVIEHVGAWPNVQAMAGEIHRLAPRHFVQTPNYWFPFEPHFRRPFYQFLPRTWRARLLVGREYDYRPRIESYAEALACVDTCNLLSARQMHALFPNSLIHRERVFGVTKSLVAIKP